MRKIQSNTQTVNKKAQPVAPAMTFDTVRELALGLEDVEVSTSYGTPALKRHGVLFARLWEDCTTLVVRMDSDRRDQMLAEDPDTYFLTDHYRSHPWILVRLSRIRPEALRDLLRLAWQLAIVPKRKRISKR